MRHILIFYSLITVIGGWYSNIQLPDPNNSLRNGLVEYVYYPDKVPWAAARQVCQSIGGDLPKFDSPEMHNAMIRIATHNYGDNVFIDNSEYWSGLIEVVEHDQIWVPDCSNLTNTDKFVTNVAGSAFDDKKYCFRLKRDHVAERRECDRSEGGILCQIFTGKPCIFVDSFNSEVLGVEMNMSACFVKCANDERCWASVEHVPNNCINLALPGHGVEGFDMRTKQCSNFTLNSTIYSSDLTGFLIEHKPNVTAACGSVTEFNISATPSSPGEAVFQTCETVNITQNVTLMSTETIYSNLTFVSTETLISNYTTTENVTMTSTEVSTTTNISVSTTTETTVNTSYVNVYVNLTDTVTTTVLFTATVNLTTHQAEEKAQELVKNLTIDVKSTSSHSRKLTSAKDKRQSSQFIGLLGVISVVLPLGLMFLIDIRKLYLDCRYHEHIYNTKKQ